MQIRDAEARRFWCSVYLRASEVCKFKGDPLDVLNEADNSLKQYAARFGDESLRADIEANEIERKLRERHVP